MPRAPALMLLGPTRWLERPVGPTSALDGSPLEARRALAARLRAEGVDVVVMEEEPDSEATSTRKFLRLVDARRVGSFGVVWPLAAEIEGVSVEMGILLRGLERGEIEGACVGLLVEENADGGVVALAEPANRTSYFRDFAAYGCREMRWRDADGLLARAGELGRAHLARVEG